MSHPFCDCPVYSNSHPIGLGKCPNPIPDECLVPRRLTDPIPEGVREWLDRINPPAPHTVN